MTAYLRPATLDQALSFIAGSPPIILAGGTDLYPATASQVLDGPILDLTALPEIRGISASQTSLRIGASTTWTEISRAQLPPALAALQQAALQVGGRQIQNAGTIGGNLCNASPAADGVPPLLAVNAKVELASISGNRILPLHEFLTGPRQTALSSGELMTAILIPNEGLEGQSCFLKLGARAYLVISIVMVAARIVVSNGVISQAALAVGSCSATACRISELEKRLTGTPLSLASQLIDQTGVGAALSPLDDLRATAVYRVEAATELLRRAVGQIAKDVR